MRWSADGLPAGLAIDATSGVISGSPGTDGVFAPTLTATDAFGSSTAHTFALRVAPAPLVSASGALTPTSAAAPRLTAVKQSASRWLSGSKVAHSAPGAGVPARKSTKPAIGTTFSFSVDQVSRITFSFHRTSNGSRVGSMCAKHTGARASRPRCAHAVREGTRRVLAPTGRNTLHFEGPISRRTALAPGSYRVAIIAGSQAGKASATRILRFTIMNR